MTNELEDGICKIAKKQKIPEEILIRRAVFATIIHWFKAKADSKDP